MLAQLQELVAAQVLVDLELARLAVGQEIAVHQLHSVAGPAGDRTGHEDAGVVGEADVVANGITARDAMESSRVLSEASPLREAQVLLGLGLADEACNFHGFSSWCPDSDAVL